MAAGLPVEKAWAVFLVLWNCVVSSPADVRTAPTILQKPESSLQESLFLKGTGLTNPDKGISDHTFRQIQGVLALAQSV